MNDATTIERDRWVRFFDELTEDHKGDQITVEVLDGSLGDQFEGERLPFAFASFDPRDDMVIISAEGKSERGPVLRHMISHPSEVDVATPEPNETVLRVVAGENSTLIYFYPKPALPGSG